MEDWKRKVVFFIPMGIIFLYLMQFIFMIIEWKHFHSYPILRELKMAGCSFFVCTGDTTILYHPTTVFHYSLYATIAFFGVILSFIDCYFNKRKMIYVNALLWVLLFLFNLVPDMVLRFANNFALSLSVYYNAFLLMQYNKGIGYLIGIFYLCCWGCFIFYTYSFLTKKKTIAMYEQ